MKALVTIMAVIFTFSASAFERPNPDMTFKELKRLRRQEKVFFVIPQFQLSDGYFINGDKLCLAGAQLDIVEPIGKKSRQKCVNWGSDNDKSCRAYKTVYPKIAVSGTRLGCTEWDNSGDDRGCTQWGQVPYSYNTEFDVKVTSHRGASNGTRDHANYGRFLFNKELNLPACVDVD